MNVKCKVAVNIKRKHKKTKIYSDPRATIKNSDMSEDVQQEAVECAIQAMKKFRLEKEIAAEVKKEFDKRFSPTWHCVVGSNFGSYVTYEKGHFIYFYLDQNAILLFKSGKQQHI